MVFCKNAEYLKKSETKGILSNASILRETRTE
jgi:hypothetical protein